MREKRGRRASSQKESRRGDGQNTRARQEAGVRGSSREGAPRSPSPSLSRLQAGNTASARRLGQNPLRGGNANAQASLAAAAVTLELEDRLRALVRAFAPTPHDVEQRQAAILSLERCLHNTPLEADLFGSGRTGLALPKSDLDFCVYARQSHSGHRHNNSSSNNNNINGLSHGANGGGSGDGGGESPPPSDRSGTPSMRGGLFSASPTSRAFMSRKDRQRQGAQEINVFVKLLRENREFSILTRIVHARVPIVKCVHRLTQVPVDVSFTMEGIATSEYLVRRLGCGADTAPRPSGSSGAPRSASSPIFAEEEDDGASVVASPHALVRSVARPLILLLKHLTYLWGLGDASVGGLGSFAQSLMVIFFVETQAIRYPCEQRGSLLYCFLGLLHFYSNFNYLNEGISVVSQCTFRKPPIAQLMIMNPLDSSKNAASACTRFASLQQRISDAFEGLHRAMSAPKAATAVLLFDEVFGLSSRARFCASDEVLLRFNRCLTDGLATSPGANMSHGVGGGGGSSKLTRHARLSPVKRHRTLGEGNSHQQVLGAAIIGDVSPTDATAFSRHGVLPGSAPVASVDPKRHAQATDELLLAKRKRPEHSPRADDASPQTPTTLRSPITASPASKNLFRGSYL